MSSSLKILQAVNKIKQKTDEQSNNIKDIKLDIIENQDSIDELNKKIEENKKQYSKLEEDLKENKKQLEDKIRNIELIPGQKGEKGEPGEKGDKGETGSQGLPGKDGKDGRDGKDGIGIPGKDGKDGVNGIDGVGIYNTEINEDGELIITLTNGRKINCGKVKGKDGVGYRGISVTDAKIINNHLIVSLSNGEDIDAGYIGGSGESTIEDIKVNNVSLPIVDKSVNIEVPTKTSDITNDSGFITSKDVPTKTSDLTNDSGFITESDIPTNVSAFTNDVGYITSYTETDPTVPNHVKSITENDITSWNNKSEFSGNYNDLTNKPTIPSKTSDLTNDSGFIDKSVDDLTNYTKTSNLATVATSGSYNDLSNKPTIPDVSNFITKDANNLTYYTLKTATGSLIDLEIDGTTYVVTLSLKDVDGNVISTDTIDLPLENVVVGGSYDNVNKKVILTLENGDTVEFSVADLVAGLQSEITSSNKLASDLVDDTNSGNKFTNTSEKATWNAKYSKPSGGIPKTDLASAVQTSLGKADTAVQDNSYVHTDNNYTTTEKNKLSGIASGAEVNVQSDWNQTTTTADDYIKNKPTIPTVNNKTITISQNGTTAGSFTLNQSSNKTINITDTTYSVATTSADGLMSSTDKTKLDGIAAGAEVNVQSDWNATSGDAFIKNKPTIPAAQIQADWNQTTTTALDYIKNKPSINNGTLTIKRNGTSIQTFTANSSSNKTADISVPTALSEMTDDATHRVVTDTEKTTWNNKANTSDIPTDFVSKASGGTFGGNITVVKTHTGTTNSRTELTVGNNKTTGTAGVSSGSLKLYSEQGTGKFVRLFNDNTLTGSSADRRYKLPVDKPNDSELAVVADIPTQASDINALPNTTKYAGSSSIGGAAISAAKLTNTTKIGDTNKPVYFTANGVPAAISYTIDKSVPSNAVFTDTTYTFAGGTDKFTVTPSGGTAQTVNITNGGVRSVATGSTFGTIAVNTNGTTTDKVLNLTGDLQPAEQQDLNDIKTSGAYYFMSATGYETPLNIPSGVVNGVLIVLTSHSNTTTGVFVKQIFMRHGTNDSSSDTASAYYSSNDQEIYVRTYNNSTWSSWHKVFASTVNGNNYKANFQVSKNDGRNGQRTWTNFYVGNSTGIGTADKYVHSADPTKNRNGSQCGRIYMYNGTTSSTTNYATILTPGANTTTRTITFPDAGGTVALTSNLTWKSGGSKTGTGNYATTAPTNCNEILLMVNLKDASVTNIFIPVHIPTVFITATASGTQRFRQGYYQSSTAGGEISYWVWKANNVINIGLDIAYFNGTSVASTTAVTVYYR